jgi:ubiquinone/menaquinone biosynthesis C-methylase UbiE
MTRSHDAVVETQFGPQAQAYVASAVHSGGADLDALEAIVARQRPARALDLGTGGGHVAYRMAPHAGAVIATDLSAEMITAVASTARDRGLANIETCVAPAENLPFESGTFDFLACRFSAHHWRDFAGGLREARRVLATGATALFIDIASPGPAALDTHLQAVELLRDVSHVRDYSAAEWIAALNAAGFAIRATHTRRLRMDFASWTERMRTPEPQRAAIRALQRQASNAVATHFAIEPDGSFTLDSLQIEAVAM